MVQLRKPKGGCPGEIVSDGRKSGSESFGVLYHAFDSPHQVVFGAFKKFLRIWLRSTKRIPKWPTSLAGKVPACRSVYQCALFPDQSIQGSPGCGLGNMGKRGGTLLVEREAPSPPGPLPNERIQDDNPCVTGQPGAVGAAAQVSVVYPGRAMIRDHGI
jgi:hypothetical protein